MLHTARPSTDTMFWFLVPVGASEHPFGGGVCHAINSDGSVGLGFFPSNKENPVKTPL